MTGIISYLLSNKIILIIVKELWVIVGWMIWFLNWLLSVWSKILRSHIGHDNLRKYLGKFWFTLLISVIHYWTWSNVLKFYTVTNFVIFAVFPLCLRTIRYLSGSDFIWFSAWHDWLVVRMHLNWFQVWFANNFIFCNFDFGLLLFLVSNSVLSGWLLYI